MALDAEDIPQDLKTRYSDFRLLGSGAMGRVYKATDNDLLIDVAIKILLGNRSPSSDAVMRFQREAQAASKLTHRNLVRVMDFGIASGDQLYLVMEFAKGQTLDSIVKGKPVSLDKVVNVISQICDAMSHAHSLGVVHRDLKPANIVVDGEKLDEATIKVVDFGIAKVGDTVGTAGSITQHGELLGTPQFMSPEQISTTPDIDGRSDIYAVGCIMFYLLTGRHPHQGTTILELLQSKLNDIAPRINEVGRHSPVPMAVEDVVAHCLSANPDDRFATMLELKEELVLAAQHTDTTGETTGDDTAFAFASSQAPSAVKRFGFVALVALALVAVVIMGVNNVSRVSSSAEKSDGQNQPIKTENLFRLFEQSSKDPSIWSARATISDKDLLLLKDQNVTSLKLQAQLEITDEALSYISKLRNLSTLCITDSRVSNNGIAYLSDCNKLSTLALSGTDITDPGLAALADLHLDDLSLERTQITGAGMKHLAKMKSLTRLKVTDTRFDDEGLKAIADLPFFSCLHAEETHITDSGMKFMPGKKTLTRLHLSATSIGEPGLRKIASYPLQELNLSSCKKVDDRCLDFICQTWPNLEKLVLSNTSVTGAGIKKIARLHQLNDLKIDGTGVGDAEFSPILELKKLKELSLRELPITDKTLARICDLPELRTIDLNDCKQTTTGGWQATRKRCPKLRRSDQNNLFQEDPSIEELL